MYAALAPWVKNATEDTIWKLDFLNQTAETTDIALEDINAVEKRWQQRDQKQYVKKRLTSINDVLQLQKPT